KQRGDNLSVRRKKPLLFSSARCASREELGVKESSGTATVSVAVQCTSGHEVVQQVRPTGEPDETTSGPGRPPCPRFSSLFHSTRIEKRPYVEVRHAMCGNATSVRIARIQASTWHYVGAPPDDVDFPKVWLLRAIHACGDDVIRQRKHQPHVEQRVATTKLTTMTMKTKRARRMRRTKRTQFDSGDEGTRLLHTCNEDKDCAEAAKRTRKKRRRWREGADGENLRE
ncbi:hypothetical protein ALC57_17214, partial [Trachymyrmex cornetzi]